jgi:hypothetical protein
MIVPYTEPLSIMAWDRASTPFVCLIVASILLYTSVGVAFGGVIYFYSSAGVEINKIKGYYWDKVGVEYVSNILTAAAILLAGCVMTSLSPIGFRSMLHFKTKRTLILVLIIIFLVVFDLCFALGAGGLAYIHGQPGTYYNDALRRSITEGIKRLDMIAMKFHGEAAPLAVRDLINLNEDYKCCALNEYDGGAPSFFNDPTRCWYQKSTPCSSIIGDYVSKQAHFIGVFGLIMGLAPIIIIAFGSILAIINYFCDFFVWRFFERETPPRDRIEVAGRMSCEAFNDFSSAPPSETDSLVSSETARPNSTHSSAPCTRGGCPTEELESSFEGMF